MWGNPITTQETVAQPFRYSSKFYDNTTGLQYLKARWYDPSVGRFINEDTYEGQFNNPLTLNLYTYVMNNPLTHTDPTGHMGQGQCNTDECKQKQAEANQQLYETIDTISYNLNALGPEGPAQIAEGLQGLKYLLKGAAALAETAEAVEATAQDANTATDAVEGTGNLFDKGINTLKNFNIDNAFVKTKHLSTTGGNGAKFLGDTKAEAEAILKDAMQNGKVTNVLDNGLTKQGNQSYEIVIDAGKEIGTRGETLVKIILSEDGAMLSAYPVK